MGNKEELKEEEHEGKKRSVGIKQLMVRDRVRVMERGDEGRVMVRVR